MSGNIKLPAPYLFIYEWKTPLGIVQRFSAAPINGADPDRTLAMITVEQAREAILADRDNRYLKERAQIEAEWIKLHEMQDAYRKAPTGDSHE